MPEPFLHFGDVRLMGERLGGSPEVTYCKERLLGCRILRFAFVGAVFTQLGDAAEHLVQHRSATHLTLLYRSQRFGLAIHPFVEAHYTGLETGSKSVNCSQALLVLRNVIGDRCDTSTERFIGLLHTSDLAGQLRDAVVDALGQ